MGVNVSIFVGAEICGGNQEIGFKGGGIKDVSKENFHPLIDLCGPPYLTRHSYLY